MGTSTTGTGRARSTASSVARLFSASIAALVVSAAMRVTPDQSKSVWAGVYTAEQAKAVEKVYTAHCATCHGDDMAGIERAPALVGGTFRESWHGATLRKLFERIEGMPPDEPKTLTAKDYVDVLAFLLSASEMPAGSAPLPTDRTLLAEITFERAKPAP
jgi:mono/diheme cytochrome c family protein